MSHELSKNYGNDPNLDEYGPPTLYEWFAQQVHDSPQPSREALEAVAEFNAMEALPTEELCRILNEAGYTGPPQPFPLPKDS